MTRIGKEKDVGISGGDRRVALLLAMTIALSVLRLESCVKENFKTMLA